MFPFRFYPVRRAAPLFFAALLLLLTAAAPGAESLREAFDTAGPGEGYDKLVILQTGVVYTGGLLIGPILSPFTGDLEGGPGMDVKIAGNGAVLDLEGTEICVSYCDNRLDIEDCVIRNGNVRFRGVESSTHSAVPAGSVRQVTFYEPHDYGVRLQGAGDGILLERNLVVGALDAGPDYIYTNGVPAEHLPTGISYAFSVQTGTYGTPEIRENWSYHPDPAANADSITHFTLLCEYG